MNDLVHVMVAHGVPARGRLLAGLAAAGLAVLVTLAGCSGGTAVPAPGAAVGQRANAALPVWLLQAPLQAWTGRYLDLSSFAGKVVVLSDVMTLCQETCPLDTANVVAAARRAERAGLGNRIEFVSLTVDPHRDTPARLAAYRKLYGPAPKDWTLATGAPATLSRIWKHLGVYIKRVPDGASAPKDWLTGKRLTYDITHSDELFFVDGRGHERFLLEGPPHIAAGAPIPRTIAKFMDAQGRRGITHPDPQAWTLPQELQVLSWLLDHRIPGSAPQ